MPAVHESRLKGNYGASVVMARLSSECLVRPVAVDTDVGLDIYCETVVEGQPFLHFWLQVKAGNQCQVDSSSTYASCRFQLDHIEYWARQPVPVFAALVPTAWPAQSEPHIYIVDITTWILFTIPTIPSRSDLITTGHQVTETRYKPSSGQKFPTLQLVYRFQEGSSHTYPPPHRSMYRGSRLCL